MMRLSILAAVCACAFIFAACSDRNESAPPTSPAASATSPLPTSSTEPASSPTPPPLTIDRDGSGKDLKVRWRWDSGLFNVIIWVRANGSKVAATYGGLYEGPANFDPQPGGIALLDAVSGTQLWRHETPTQAFPAAFNAGVVAAGTGDGTVYAWDEATGAERWRLTFDGIPFQVMKAAGVFVVADADPETWGPNGLVDKTRLGGRVWGIDPANGTVLWKTTVGSFNAFIAVESLVTGGLIAAASSSPAGDGSTVVLDPASGREIWRKPLEASSPPAVEGSLLVVPGPSLRAFELVTGTTRWEASVVGGGTYFFPGITGNAVVSGANTGALDVFNARTGELFASAQIGECAAGQWFQGFGLAYGLLCGSLVRLDHDASGWTLTTILTPQGAIDSAAPAGAGIVISTGIGTTPEQVLFIEP